MSRGRKILLTVLILFLFLVLAVSIWLISVVRGPFPTTSGTIDVPGLQAEVTVVRDDLGIPHIYAANEHDLFFAQGYTHAQDRFWQMEWARHIGNARLSEIVGEPMVETDKFLRNLGWPQKAQAAAATYDGDTLLAMEAYSAGVNAYIAQNSDNVSLNRTILELVGESWEIEPWTPVDTAAWGMAMAWDLRGSGNSDFELLQVEMRNALGDELVDQLFPVYPDNRPIIAPTAKQPAFATRADYDIDWAAISTQLIGTAPADFGWDVSGIGSNNWVVNGDHTESGLPLLADDPHLSVQMPSIWYENGLHGGRFDVVGVTMPGVPGVILGHNDKIAWGVTNVSADTQDLFIEKINPDNPNQYEYMGEWRDMDVRTEIIKVNGGDPVELTVRETIHGPLLNNVDDELQDALALQWTAAEPSRQMKAIIELNKAQNVDEFFDALQYWDTAGQNIVYGDVEGNIAYQATGRYPIRPNWDGILPVPGWTGEYEWDGFIPYAEMPRLLNPEEGYIVTANNAIHDDQYPYTMALYWADGDRAQRIVDMVEDALAAGPISAETYHAMHNDNYELLADSYMPLIAQLASDDAQMTEVLTRLRQWDRQLDADSVPAAIFQVFYMHLAQRVLTDELGDTAEDYLTNNGVVRVLFHDLAGKPDHPFWDNRSTPEVETQAQQVELALQDAVAWFNQITADPDRWQWGEIHTVTYGSDPLGQSGIALIENMVNRGPYPYSGGNSIVNATSFGWDNMMASDGVAVSELAAARANPSMRMIIDLADFDSAELIHPTGQSGHPYHPNYTSMIETYLAGDYVPMTFSAEAVAARGKDMLILQPASQ
ncbi:MAG: penicillin acylase family protein [Anaerolineae bacterium]|nr:penicillin acylase family protein [Anaerolineae bacterium]